MTNPQISQDKEIARVNIGVPGIVQVEIPIRSSFFAPVLRVFRRQDVRQLVHVAYARALVHASEDDAGTIDTYTYRWPTCLSGPSGLTSCT